MNTWKIDQAHSEIGFKVKHLMVSNVRGHFTNFDGSIALPDEDFTKAVISFSAETKSINTNNTMRDGHLQSADFFDAEKFPTLSFESSNITKNSDNNFTVTGTLTMHGVTQEVNLNAVLNGTTKDMNGNSIMSFDVTGSISREVFGLVWNATLETGGVAVSDEVKLDISAEFKKEGN